MLGLDDRRLGQAFLQSREDFHALDRIDAEVGVEEHVGLEHLGRIAGLLRDDLPQDGRNVHGFRRVDTAHQFRDRVGGAHRTQELGDLPQGSQRAEVLGLDDRRLGQAFLQGREDLDALDRIDAEVGVEEHVGLEHLGRIAGLLRDDLDQDGMGGRSARLGDRSGRPDLGLKLGRRRAEPRWGGLCDRLPRGEGMDSGRGARDRNGRRRGFQAERDEREPLLLFEQGLEGALGPVLAVEELPMELGRLLAELLEGGQVLLDRPDGLRQPGRVAG